MKKVFNVIYATIIISFISITCLTMLYGVLSIGVDIVADHHSEVDYSIPILGIENSTYTARTGGKSPRDYEVNRYNYVVKEGSDYTTYYINYSDVTITPTDGQEKIEFYKGVYDRPMFNKYFGKPSDKYKSRFYLHKDTIEKLGINVN